jgi:NAD-dependent deacetylase
MPRPHAKPFQRIVILTGAGISAESGIATFRDKDGLWAKHDISEVATPEAFARNPAQVQGFYNQRRSGVLDAKPNAAHLALAKLEHELPKQWPGAQLLLVTQNVDPLHERAGSKAVVHMHGELLSAWCESCDGKHRWEADLGADTACPACTKPGHMRPDIVWFGEMPYHMDRIENALAHADLFISIGTSGNVYPAAGFVAGARFVGAHTVELNLEPSAGASHFHERRHGQASVIVPAFVDALLAGARWDHDPSRHERIEPLG